MDASFRCSHVQQLATESQGSVEEDISSIATAFALAVELEINSEDIRQGDDNAAQLLTDVDHSSLVQPYIFSSSKTPSRNPSDDLH